MNLFIILDHKNTQLLHYCDSVLPHLVYTMFYHTMKLKPWEALEYNIQQDQHQTDE